MPLAKALAGGAGMETMTMEATRALIFGVVCQVTILLTLGLIVICTWCSRPSPTSPERGDS
jgi:hypothetical protein